MSYVLPKVVSSPRDHWELIDVLCDGGPQNASVAFGRWDEDEVVALRWNGDDTEGSALGNPQSRGLATWFVLPDWLAEATLQTLLARAGTGDSSVNRAALDRALKHFRKAR